MSYTINCNNYPWRVEATREETIKTLRDILKTEVDRDSLYSIEYDENKGLLDIWYKVGEAEEIEDQEYERIIYTVTKNKQVDAPKV